jgi:hypothetical protein
MTTLTIDPAKLSRAMTRQDWRKIHRWIRQASKVVEAETDRRMQNLICFGTTHPVDLDAASKIN